MSEPSDGSVTVWLGHLVTGGATDAAAQELWERYFSRLVGLARVRLRSSARRVADEEDVALSAFDSFCQGAAAGRFPKLGGRDDLWRVLVTITARKAFDQRQHENRRRRGGGKVFGEDFLAHPDDQGRGGLDQFVGKEPTPAFAAQVADECRRLLSMLRDDKLRQIALLRMEGYSNEQVAERLDLGLRTIERKLDLIRKTWQSAGGAANA
jgi:DNA-directed RNA polymerase specialized sigma24 family protein